MAGLLKIAVLSLLAAPVLLWVAGQLGGLKGQTPSDLGVHNGRLKSPSLTPNSVSSQAVLEHEHPQKAYAAIAPFPLRDNGPVPSIKALAAALQQLPGTLIVEQTPDYIYAQSTTQWLKFTDDVEFWFNPALAVIEVRSASRLGSQDFGANRQRVEALRAIYLHP